MKITNSERGTRRFILTGAPGSGKTAIIRQLELDGFSVVEEAATDVIALGQAQGIAEPWNHPSFIDSIIELQRRRQVQAREMDEVQFHDRSAICTAALAVYLGYPFSDTLSHELKRIETEAIYQKRVFFIQHLGFITPTEARRISLEEALCFERVHEETYRTFGFEFVPVAPGSLSDRVDAIKRSVRSGHSAQSRPN
jgi:predicted ATPase